MDTELLHAGHDFGLVSDSRLICRSVSLSTALQVIKSRPQTLPQKPPQINPNFLMKMPEQKNQNFHPTTTTEQEKSDIRIIIETNESKGKKTLKTFHFLLLSAHFQIAHSFAWKQKDV
jgi:hypothetical protein